MFQHPLFRLIANRDNKGFTLVELMVAVAIIGIAAAIAVPNVTGWLPHMKLKSSARSFYSTMHKARMMALKEDDSVAITLRPANENYVIHLDDGGTTGIANDGVQNGDERTLTISTMPPIVDLQSVNLTDTSNVVGFNSRGLPFVGTPLPAQKDGNVVFRLVGRTDRWYRITISITGDLQLEISTDSTNGTDGNWS